VTTILRQGLPPVIRLLERGAGFERSDAPGSGARLALVNDNTRGVAPRDWRTLLSAPTGARFS
jgi:hypothetical protein